MSTKTPRSGAEWRSRKRRRNEGTSGRLGARRSMAVLDVLAHSLSLPAHLFRSHYFSFFFMLQFVVPYFCGGAVERLEAVGDIENRPMGVQSVGRTRTSDLPGCGCKAGLCRRHQGPVLGRSRVKPMPLLLCRARTCIAVPTPSRLPPVCLSPFERE